MKIPNDTGHPHRLNKFVEYQHEVPSLHYRTVRAYVLEEGLNADDAIMLAWYLSVTYNEITAILLFNMLDWRTMKLKDVNKLWEEYKPVLDFGSARKYAKNMDWYVPLMDSWMRLVKRQPSVWLSAIKGSTGEERYTALYKQLRAIKYCGRFAADIFMETIICMCPDFGWNFSEPLSFDWQHSSNLTSGLMNIFYEDEAADRFDKTGYIAVETAQLLNWLMEVQLAIAETYPEQDNNIMSWVGKVCSFRNLFKNARYGGFHHDRQLGVIRGYEKALPSYQGLWDSCYELRSGMFSHHLLGEIGGWSGIRKERKKLWTTQGLTGVERI
jgi:hypothetical protein